MVGVPESGGSVNVCTLYVRMSLVRNMQVSVSQG
jgi:hypothetical protein